MNVMGNIGNFIIKNQDLIQLAVIIIIALLVVIFAIKGIVNARKKRDILAQINDTVKSIDGAVTNLGSNNGKDIIYIDNRSPEKIISEKCEEDSSAQPPSGQPCEAIDDNQSARSEDETEQGTKKYFYRDCGIDKNGRTYTIEELNDQIKE